MKFRYARYGSILRPVIPIKVKYGEKKIGYHVLVDSGADSCFFDAEIGEALGIKIKSGQPKEVFGVGGKASIYYVHKIRIIVGGYEHEVSVGFIYGVGVNHMPYGIVGQTGFFDKFVVKFDFLKEEVELKQRK